jgi:hypothetical protein
MRDAVLYVNFASDATEMQIAALEMDDPSNQEIQLFNDNILVNELKAAMLRNLNR